MSDMTPRLAWDAPNPRSYLRGAPVIDRLLYRTSTSPDGCWVWRGTTNEHGYGEIGMGGDVAPVRRVHRVAYEHFKGPIPEGMTIDHLCRNPSCVNPDHLEPVTHAENIRRGWRARPHWQNNTCKHGHPRTSENTYLNGRGHRECRDCWRSPARKAAKP